MEVQFQKTTIPCLQMHMRQVQVQEETLQLRLPETFPDIGRVLASWGQVLLNGKQWHNDRAGVTGGVKTWVLYEPVDGTMLQCVESWLPFQMNWDMPEVDRDGTMIVCPAMPNVDARMLSDRKLMVRAGVRIELRAMILSDHELLLPEEMPPDVQALRNTYPVLLPTEAGEKAFELEQTIAIPSAEQPIRTLMRYTLQPVLTECKLVADKLVLRGNAQLHILYTGTDDRLHSWITEVPFSQFVQLEEQYDSGAEARLCFAMTALEAELGEDGSIMLKAGITAQYILYDRKWITLVEDIYSPTRCVKPGIRQMQLPSVLDMQRHMVHAELPYDAVPSQRLDTMFLPDAPQVCIEGDQIRTELSGTFQILGINDEGAYCVENARWEDTWVNTVSQDADVHISLENPTVTQTAGGGIKVEIPVYSTTEARQPMDMVVSAEMGEITEADPERPSLILCRIGDDCLWELAKRCGSTVDAIRKLNALEQDPDPDQLLLIPVI